MEPEIKAEIEEAVKIAESRAARQTGRFTPEEEEGLKERYIIVPRRELRGWAVALGLILAACGITTFAGFHAIVSAIAESKAMEIAKAAAKTAVDNYLSSDLGIDFLTQIDADKVQAGIARAKAEKLAQETGRIKQSANDALDAINQLSKDADGTLLGQLASLRNDLAQPTVSFSAYLESYPFKEPNKAVHPFGFGEAGTWCTPRDAWQGNDRYTVPESGVYLLMLSFVRNPKGEDVSDDVILQVFRNGKSILMAWAGIGDPRKTGVGQRLIVLQKGEIITVHAIWQSKYPWPTSGTHQIQYLRLSGIKMGNAPLNPASQSRQ